MAGSQIPPRTAEEQQALQRTSRRSRFRVPGRLRCSPSKDKGKDKGKGKEEATYVKSEPPSSPSSSSSSLTPIDDYSTPIPRQEEYLHRYDPGPSNQPGAWPAYSAMYNPELMKVMYVDSTTPQEHPGKRDQNDTQQPGKHSLPILRPGPLAKPQPDWDRPIFEKDPDVIIEHVEQDEDCIIVNTKAVVKTKTAGTSGLVHPEWHFYHPNEDKESPDASD